MEIKFIPRRRARFEQAADVSVHLNRTGKTGKGVALAVIFRNGAEKKITDGEYIRIGTSEERPGVLFFAPGNARNGHKISMLKKCGNVTVKTMVRWPEAWEPFTGDFSLEYDEENAIHYCERNGGNEE